MPTYQIINQMEILENATGVRVGTITSRNHGDAAIAVLTNRILNSSRMHDKQQICIDVGAAQGWWATLAAKHGYAVTAFEPDSVGYAKLLESIKLNGLDKQVDCVNAAISNVDAVQTLRTNGEQSFIEGLREISADVDANPDWPTIDVETCRLDTVLSSLGDDAQVPLMKVDTEGHEMSVFSGANESISKIGAIITEFSIYWYGVDETASVAAGVGLMKRLASYYEYVYMLSRVGTVYYIGPIGVADFEKFCEDLYATHLQVDLVFMRTPIPPEWGLQIVGLDQVKLR